MLFSSLCVVKLEICTIRDSHIHFLKMRCLYYNCALKVDLGHLHNSFLTATSWRA